MIAEQTVVLRVVLAAVLGGVVGLERERLERAAGMRTHALVAAGSALIMIVSSFGFADILGTRDVTLDPSRVAAQVVSGVGFLGAGTIILHREVVRGLTTAASVWTVAGIGLAAGGGLYLAAVATTVVALIILFGLRPVEGWLFTHRRQRTITLAVEREQVSLADLESAVQRAGLRLDRAVIRTNVAPGRDRVELVLAHAAPANVRSGVEQLRRIAGVVEISALGPTSRADQDAE